MVVEVLTNKSTYNTLELTSGRMAKVSKGDIVVGALGHRKALFGYSGHVPESIKPGDVIQMLNIGGVLGICDSMNADRGRPFDCRVLGVVLQFPYLGERIGVPARIGQKPLDLNSPLDTQGVPVVALAGSCMEAGKTAAACAIIARMRHRGLAVHAFKATGVSLRRDILAMEDAGARKTMIFTDFGVGTTTAKVGPALTRAMLTEMAEGTPTSSSSSSATDCSAPTASSRSSRRPISATRSASCCCRPTTRSRPGAASSCCATSSASSPRS